MEIRKCMKCKREKPYYEFYTDNDNTCIECTKEDVEMRRIINNESVKQLDRKTNQ